MLVDSGIEKPTEEHVLEFIEKVGGRRDIWWAKKFISVHIVVRALRANTSTRIWLMMVSTQIYARFAETRTTGD
jgi:hypothetical protein